MPAEFHATGLYGDKIQQFGETSARQARVDLALAWISQEQLVPAKLLSYSLKWLVRY
jgi:hypothetical protein